MRFAYQDDYQNAVMGYEDGLTFCDQCGWVEHDAFNPEDVAHCPCGGGPCDCECHTVDV